MLSGAGLPGQASAWEAWGKKKVIDIEIMFMVFEITLARRMPRNKQSGSMLCALIAPSRAPRKHVDDTGIKFCASCAAIVRIWLYPSYLISTANSHYRWVTFEIRAISTAERFRHAGNRHIKRLVNMTKSACADFPRAMIWHNRHLLIVLFFAASNHCSEHVSLWAALLLFPISCSYISLTPLTNCWLINPAVWSEIH